MADARTILGIAGANPTPHALNQSAVVMIDAQMGRWSVMIDAQMKYVTGIMPLTGVEAALEEGERFLAAARAAGRAVTHVQHRAVIHVQHKGNPGGLSDLEGPAFPIADPVAPQGDEAVVVKSLPNSFAGTNLDDAIRATGASSVIFAGLHGSLGRELDCA